MSLDPTTFGRSARLKRLSNGAFVETNLSATAIHRTCLQALQIAGIGHDEWQVERVSLAPDADEVDAEPTETKQLQLEFWLQVRAALDATGAFTSLQAARPRYWFDIAIGRSDYWLTLNANVSHGKLFVKMMIADEEGQGMPAFVADRAAIENEIGSTLDWNPHPENKFKCIRASRPTQLLDRTAWPDGIAWLTANAMAFKRTFGPRVAKLGL